MASLIVTDPSRLMLIPVVWLVPTLFDGPPVRRVRLLMAYGLVRLPDVSQRPSPEEVVITSLPMKSLSSNRA